MRIMGMFVVLILLVIVLGNVLGESSFEEVDNANFSESASVGITIVERPDESFFNSLITGAVIGNLGGGIKIAFGFAGIVVVLGLGIFGFRRMSLKEKPKQI